MAERASRTVPGTVSHTYITAIGRAPKAAWQSQAAFGMAD